MYGFKSRRRRSEIERSADQLLDSWTGARGAVARRQQFCSGCAKVNRVQGSPFYRVLSKFRNNKKESILDIGVARTHKMDYSLIARAWFDNISQFVACRRDRAN